MKELSYRYGHETLITSLSGQRSSMSSHNNTRILSSSTDNTIRLWKIEANTQMVYRGRRMDQSIECCSMASYQHFITGDVNGSVNLFSADKKKSIYSVKVDMSVIYNHQNAHGVDESGNHVNLTGGKWIVSCNCLPFTNVLATGSYDDCIRLWDINPTNRENDGELLKPVNTVPVVSCIWSVVMCRMVLSILFRLLLLVDSWLLVQDKSIEWVVGGD